MFDYIDMSEAELKENFDLNFRSEFDPTGKFTIEVGPHVLRGEIERDVYHEPDSEELSMEDNLFKVLSFTGNYSIGHTHGYEKNNRFEMIAQLVSEYDQAAYDRWESSDQNPSDYDKILVKFDKYYIHKPVYVYEHSGITISTQPFSCQWDSGTLGIAICAKDEYIKAYGFPRLTAKRTADAMAHLDSQVQYFDDLIQGNVYGFTVELDDVCQDSCWGFVGNNSSVRGELKAALFYYWAEVKSRYVVLEKHWAKYESLCELEDKAQTSDVPLKLAEYIRMKEIADEIYEAEEDAIHTLLESLMQPERLKIAVLTLAQNNQKEVAELLVGLATAKKSQALAQNTY